MLIGREASGTTFSKGSKNLKSTSRSKIIITANKKSTNIRYPITKHVSDSESETSESEDESGSEDQSGNEESVDEKLDCKVTIGNSGEVRGFSVSFSKGFYMIMKQLEESYGTRPRLSYYDDEGDKISILASTDFEYAVRAHKNTTTLDRKGKKLGANKLTFIAEFGCGQMNAETLRSGSASRPLSYSPLLSSFPSSSKLSLAPCTYSCADVPSAFASVNEIKESNEVIWQRGELLGSGAFGQVYSGIDMSTGVRIAVKEVMLGSGKKQEQQAMALLREIKILSELDHPNIIKYLGTEYSEHTMRIFLELATEGSLKDAISAFGALAEPIIRRYTLDIVSGLAFLHSKRIIHRDVKPTNLLISNGVIKVADFGCSSSSFDTIAGYATSEMGHATVTGTTVYMAPEVMGVEDEAFNAFGNSSDSRDSDPTITKFKRKNIIHARYKKEGCDQDARSGANTGADADHCTVGKGHASIQPIPTNKSHEHQDSLLDDSAIELEKENKNDSELSTTHVVRKQTVVIKSTHEHESEVVKDKRHGYGRKADVWSLGVTLSEMSTGRSPYRTAAAAIYSVCVSKKYPSFPDEMSTDAHSFLSRCLVADPRLRAGCEELLIHSFLKPQTVAQLKLQSATHTCSTISFRPPEPSSSNDLKTIREETNSKSVSNVAPYTSALQGKEKGSRQISMGATDSWTMSTSARSQASAGTTPVQKENKNTGQKIILSKTTPSIQNRSTGRPHRVVRK